MHKKNKLVLLLFFMLTFFVGCSSSTQEGFGSRKSEDVIKAETSYTEEKAKAEEPAMKVHFIDVGQADSILITSKDQAMLVDAGNNDDASFLLQYLTEQGIKKLDYVIGTHPHEDHIGSLDRVIENFDIDTVIMPNKVHTSQTFQDVITAIEDKNLKITKPVVGNEYVLGDAKFTILGPVKDYGDELNNWSVGIKISDGTHSFVLCGDAETEAEYDMVDTGLDLSADVLKLCHHGSSTSSSELFLKEVNPSFAVIMAGVDNQYGHPHSEVMDRLEEMNIEVYRTDQDGTIVVESTKDHLIWNTYPDVKSDHYNGKEGKDQGSDEEGAVKGEESLEEVMVHKTKSGKRYHLANCTSLENSDIEISLEDAKKEGLTPCKICNPPE
ncbi:MAG TPA: MBL fold metallo-hydrolase [Candidatus Merdenecus merdavium]|nr:MBL fold metallo-hydrolase [Candidatus Merdenecus merdavium]